MRALRIGIITLISLAALWTAGFAVSKWSLDSEVEKALAVLPADTAASTSTNVPARRIAEASTAIGFPLEVRTGGRSRVDDAADTAHHEIGTWLNEQSGELSAITSPPPPGITSFFAGNAEKFNALDAAVDSGQAVWKYDVENPDGPLPNLLSHITLVRMYAARALEAEIGGRHDEAWEHLRRANALAEAVSDRPELISNLIALTEIGMIARTSLHLRGTAPDWAREMTRQEISGAIVRSEAHDVSTLADTFIGQHFYIADDEAVTLFTLAGRASVLPWATWTMRNRVSERRKFFESLIQSGGCSIGASNASQVHAIANRIEVTRRELELARLVYEVRSGAPVQPQRVCGYAWTIARDEAGVHFAIPEAAPHRELGVEIRAFHLPIAPAPVRPADL